MTTGRRASDWLRLAPPASSGGERRGLERRSTDRRAPRRKLDAAFAATLINQVIPAEAPPPIAYEAAPPELRRGVFYNFRA